LEKPEKPLLLGPRQKSDRLVGGSKTSIRPGKKVTSALLDGEAGKAATSGCNPKA